MPKTADITSTPTLHLTNLTLTELKVILSASNKLSVDVIDKRGQKGQIVSGKLVVR
jgi:hypothetical protein